MKVLVIPDVHLKPWMFERADKIMEQGVAERAVCLMDIPDDWNQEYNLELYMETFDAAIAFAKKYPETLWVYGNHDLSYIWNEPESGYSPAAAYTVAMKLDELACALPEGNEIRYIQKIDNVLFCHGGLRDYFVKKTVPEEKYINMYGKTKNLKELAELISGAEKFLCSDSAPLHIAVALGVKTYVIFGSTDDKKLIPQNGKVIPIKADCDCPLRPCLWERRQTTCETLDCLNISADKVVESVLRH